MLEGTTGPILLIFRGCCVDCNHPQRIGNDFVLIAGQFVKGRIKAIFIDGDCVLAQAAQALPPGHRTV